jgi:hypothetical protein
MKTIRFLFLGIILCALFQASPLFADAEQSICATPLFEEAKQALAARYPHRSSPAGGSRGGPYHSVGDTMTFWAWDLSVMPPIWIQVPATCRAVGDYCYVFISDTAWNVHINQAVVSNIVNAWDHSTPGDPGRGIYELNTENFGPPPDSHDNDDWIYLFYYEMGSFGGTVFDGYFNVFNQYTEEEAQGQGGHSNEVEMFYMSCHPRDPMATLNVLAHEFEHMIHWNMDPNEVSWVDEGCAEYAMYLYGEPDPMTGFPNNPDNDLTSWDQQWADYIQTYLFMMYLHDKYGGPPMLTALVAEPGNSIEGVNSALSTMGYAASFREVFYDWVIANYLDDASFSGGRYAYDSINLPAFNHSASHSSYPVTNVNASVNHWAADYIRLTNGDDMEIAFNGSDNNLFGLRGIKLNGSQTMGVDTVLPGANQAVSDLFPGFGTTYDTLILTACGLSSSGTTAYQYSAYRADIEANILTGPGPGPANPTLVRGFSDTGAPNGITDFTAFPDVQGFGVKLDAGDLDADLTVEILAAPGPGPANTTAFRGFELDGTPLPGFGTNAYGRSGYGLNAVCGVMDTDGRAEILTAPGPGPVYGPHVRGWDYSGSAITAIANINFFAYGTKKFGCNVVAGDVDGDGYDEILTGAGSGGIYGPHIRGFDYDGNRVTPITGINFIAYNTRRFGVKVKCGDVDGDGYDEIITTPGPGPVFGPHVRGWNYDAGYTATGKVVPIYKISYFAYNRILKFGANAAGFDLDTDGFDEIVTAPGPGPTYPSHIRGWDYDNSEITTIGAVNFMAYGQTYYFGAYVSGGLFDF